jgi:hypothetical protein
MRTYIALLLLSASAALAGPPVTKTTLAVTDTSATTGTLGARTISFYCDTAVYWRASTSAPEVAVTTDFPLAASVGGVHHIVTVALDKEFNRISVIRQTANGNCYFWSHR